MRKYFRTLIIPFIFFNTIFFVLKPILFWNGIWNAGKLSECATFSDLLLKYLPICAKQLITGNNAVDGPTWFLIALFWCKVFTNTLIKHPLLWIVFFLLYIVFPLTHHGLIFLRQACQALPFYFIGFYFKDKFHKIQQFSVVSKLLIGIFALGLSVLLTSINGKVSLYATMYGNYPIYISIWIFYLNALFGSFSILILSAIFKERNYIKTMGLSLITILGGQNLFIYTFRSCFGSELSVNYLWISVLILIGCVFIHQLIEKYIPFVLGKENEKNEKYSSSLCRRFW